MRTILKGNELNWLGANLEDLTKLKVELERVANEVAKVNTDISKSIHEAWWKGKDADTFRQTWDGMHTQTLKAITESLRIASEDVEQQRRSQEKSSGA
jgi:uncharacterized coiled-coil DUF342 family protein